MSLSPEERARRLEFLRELRAVSARFGLQIRARDVAWILPLAADEEPEPVYLDNHIDSESA